MNSLNGRDAIAIFGANGNLARAFAKSIPPDIHKVLIRRTGVSTSELDVKNSEEFTLEYCDINRTSDIIELADRLSKANFRVRYVVICAGDGRFLGNATDAIFYAEEALRQFSVNALAPLLICSAFFHAMWKHRVFPNAAASVVVVSSSASLHVFSNSGQANYAGSKSGTNMLVRHLAEELLPFYVNVNAIAPTSFPAIVATEAVAVAVGKLLISGLTGKIVELSQ